MYSRPEEVVEFLTDLLKTNAGQLGIKYVGSYDEKLVPRYPAVVVSAGSVEKALHATHTFAVVLRSFLWVYHGDMTITHSKRSLADLQLATSIVSTIEADMSMSGNIIQGWIEAETPGLIQPRSAKGSTIVGTRLNWQGVTQSRY